MALVEMSSISLFPAFSRLASDQTRFRAAYLRALRLVVTAAAAATMMIVAVGQPLVVIVLGEQWRGAGPALVAMAGLALGKAVTTVSEEAIKGAGRTKLLYQYTLLETTLAIGLLVALVYPFGLVGVGLSISLTSLAVGIFVASLAAPVVGVTRRETTGVTVPSVLSAVVAGGVVVPLEYLVFHSDDHGLWVGLGLVTLDGLVFLICYVVALRLIARATFEEVKAVCGSLWGRVTAMRASAPTAPATDGQHELQKPPERENEQNRQ
jgi:PST family polysaccharide transporter